jgi:hypothetical protein
MKLEFEFTDKRDDKNLRELLERNPVPGSFTLKYTRNPSFFESIKIMGKKNRVLVCRKDNQKIVAVGIYSYPDCYIQGRVQEIGYMHSLRVDKDVRASGVLFKGIRFMRKAEENKNIPFYLTTIIEDNHDAIKVLTSKRFGLPNYIDIGRYITYAVLLKNKKKKNVFPEFKIKNVSSINELEKAVDFINKQGAKKLFYPKYSAHDLLNYPGLDYKKIYAAYYNNEIVGVLGAWDQSDIKQTSVDSYNLMWKIIKPFYNAVCFFSGYKTLPECGEKFSYVFLPFLALENNGNHIFEALLTHIYNRYNDKKYHYLMIGLHEKDSVNKVLEKFRVIKYCSRMYIASYKKVDKKISDSSLIPYLECARI